MILKMPLFTSLKLVRHSILNFLYKAILVADFFFLNFFKILSQILIIF